MTASDADHTASVTTGSEARAAGPAWARAGVGRPRRLHVVRDLRDPPPEAIDATVSGFAVVVASQGLTRSAAPTVEARRDAHLLPTPVVWVLGVAQIRGRDRKPAIVAASRSANRLATQPLVDSAAMVTGVRFVGAMCWTDFEPHGSDVDILERAFEAAEADVGHARHIRPDGGPFSSCSSAWAHPWSRVWITGECAARRLRRPDGRSHRHALSWRGPQEASGCDPLAPAHANLTDEMAGRSGFVVWIHGNVQVASDHLIGTTRVVAHSVGTRDHVDDGGDGSLVIEMGRPGT